jgi:hypothetical protein
MTDHIVACRQPVGAQAGWGVWERTREAWSEIGSSNRSLSRAIDDACGHASQWFSAAPELGYVEGPDLTISQRSFDVLSSSPVQLPDKPDLLDPIYSLDLLLPLGDEFPRSAWGRILRPAGIDSRMCAAGDRLNGLRVAAEIREQFTEAELARFEAGVDFSRGFRSEIWVRPGWSARALLPAAFSPPLRRSPEAQADFEAKVAANREKMKKNARRDQVQARNYANAATLARTDNEA